MKEHAKLNQAFEELKAVPDRDPATVQANRAAFLQEAHQFSQQPVSNTWFARLIDNYRLTHTRTQFSTLTIGILLAALMLTFSSSVYAARKSAPNQFLYPLKLWLEDSRLGLTSDPHEQIDLRLDYAEERLKEIEGYTGESADPELAAALQNFDDHYLILGGAVDLDDVQEQRWEEIQEQYQFIHSEDEEDKEDEEAEDQEDKSENQEDQSDQDENSGENDELNAPNNPTGTDEEHSESENEDISSENNNAASTDDDQENDSEKDQESDEDSPKETQSPEDDSDDGDDSEEDSTEEPDPTPDEEPDSTDEPND